MTANKKISPDLAILPENMYKQLFGQCRAKVKCQMPNKKSHKLVYIGMTFKYPQIITVITTCVIESKRDHDQDWVHLIPIQ